MNIKEYIRKQVRKTINEANDRDPFVSVRNQGTYDVTNASDLRSMFFDPVRKVNNGEFVIITYVEDAAVNKTFRNSGYVDKYGNTVSASDIESQGRALGKDYINDFFDSDEYKKKLSKKQGGKRPFAIFRTVTQQLNWASMNYDKRLADEDDIFTNASDEDLNDFTSNDRDFKARIEKFKELHPDMADEIEHYESTNSFPKEIVNRIRKVKLRDSGKGWNLIDGNPYVSRHDKTGNEALRLTKHSNLQSEYQSYVIFSDNTIKRISKEEFFFLQKAFGGGIKKTNSDAVETSIRKALNAVKNRYNFRDYLIPQIAKMSFTIDGKPVTYKNHELNVGGIIIDADDFLNSPMAESKTRISITKKQLRNIIQESVSNILKDISDEGSEKTAYYYLPTDSFGQPSGEIRELELTPEEYMKRKQYGDYIYDDYATAIRRAYD